MITANGKTALRRFLAAYGVSIADTIVIGLGDAAGESMQCEWARFSVTNVGTNVDNSQLIFKSSASIGIVGQVREVGLLQGAGGLSNDTYISYFNLTQENWTGGTFTTTNARLDTGLKVAANASASTLTTTIDVSKFNQQDVLTLAGFAGAAGSVKVTLTFDNGSTVLATFAVPAGYSVVSLPKSSLTKTGTVNWQAITQLTVNPTVDYTADILKFSVVNPLNEILIARKVLTAPFVTSTSLPLEIEYPLGVNLGAA